jgi:hypothetical protein
MPTSGTLTITKKSAPRIVVGGDGRLEYLFTGQFYNQETSNKMDCPFKYVEGASLCPIGNIPNDLRITDTPVDGVIPRDANGQIGIARTDTSASGNFFGRLIGHA